MTDVQIESSSAATKKAIRNLLQGSEALSIGAYGEYADIDSAVTYINTQTNVVQDRTIVGTGITVAVDSDSDIVTFNGTGVNLVTNIDGVLQGKTVWSPDGIYWYEVEQVVAVDQIVLAVPYFGTTIASGAVYLGTPKTYDLNLQTGIHDRCLLLSIDFAHININADRGAFIENNSGVGGGSVISPQLSGRLTLNGIYSTNSAFDGGSILLAAGAKRVHVVVNGCDFDHNAVDCIAGGAIGRFEANNSKFGSAQDGINVSQRKGNQRAVFNNCELFFHPDAVLIAPLHARCIWDGRFQLNRCRLLCQCPAESGVSGGVVSMMFDPSDATYDVEAVDCVIRMTGHDAAESVFIKPNTGLIFNGHLNFTRCKFESDFTIGEITMIADDSWTGTGTVNFDDCDLGGHDMGGAAGSQAVTYDVNKDNIVYPEFVTTAVILKPWLGGTQIMPLLSAATTFAGFQQIALFDYAQAGSRLTMVYEQDSTGGYTMLLPGLNFGTTSFLAGVANSKRIIEWLHDGSKYQIVSDSGWYGAKASVIAYASLFTEDGQSGTPITQTPNTAPVKYTGFDTVAKFANASANHANDILISFVGGAYEIGFQCSFAGTDGSIVTFELYKDVAGTPTPTGFRTTRKLGTGGDVGSCSIPKVVLDLTVDENIAMYVWCDGATDTVDTHDAQFTMNRIG